MMQAPAHPGRERSRAWGEAGARASSERARPAQPRPGRGRPRSPGPRRSAAILPQARAGPGPGPAPGSESLPPPPAPRLGLELAPNAAPEPGRRRVPGKGCCLPSPSSPPPPRRVGSGWRGVDEGGEPGRWTARQLRSVAETFQTRLCWGLGEGAARGGNSTSRVSKGCRLQPRYLSLKVPVRRQ